MFAADVRTYLQSDLQPRVSTPACVGEQLPRAMQNLEPVSCPVWTKKKNVGRGTARVRSFFEGVAQRRAWHVRPLQPFVHSSSEKFSAPAESQRSRPVKARMHSGTACTLGAHEHMFIHCDHLRNCTNMENNHPAPLIFINHVVCIVLIIFLFFSCMPDICKSCG